MFQLSVDLNSVMVSLGRVEAALDMPPDMGSEIHGILSNQTEQLLRLLHNALKY